MKNLKVYLHWGPCFGCSLKMDLNDHLLCSNCQDSISRDGILPNVRADAHQSFIEEAPKTKEEIETIQATMLKRKPVL